MNTWDDVLGIKPKEIFKCRHFFNIHNEWKCDKCNKKPKEIWK